MTQMSAEFRVVALIAAFNEGDIIAAALRHLISEGIDAYLLDDGSTDNTIQQATPFLNRGLIGIERREAPTGVEFSWGSILARKEELARALDAHWFIHHDADEVRETPWPSIKLREGIESVDRLGYSAIDFHVLTFPPTDESYLAGRSIEDAFKYCEPGSARDWTQIKCWKNTDARVDLVSSGGHNASFAGRHVFPLRFLLRHYPVRGQRHGERKVLTERQPRFLQAERDKGWHVQYDGIRAGHNFLRNPRELERYDGAKVRARLADSPRYEAIADRDVRIDQLTREVESVREAASRAVADLTAALGIERSRIAEQVAQMRQNAELAAARERVVASALDEARRATGAARADVDALKGSRSWRLTRPLRVMQNWLLRQRPGAHDQRIDGADRRRLRWGDFQRLTPISDNWGVDRGQPVDRYYIGSFLASHASDVRGRVLEIKDPGYTRNVGGHRVTTSEVLDIRPDNPQATIVADLTAADVVPGAQFDCFILTQTLHIVFDVAAAVRQAARLLKDDGVLLATIPAVSRVNTEGADVSSSDYWRLTSAAVEALFQQAFHPSDLTIETYGNVHVCAAFLYGLAVEDLDPETLAYADPLFPLIHCVRAVKRKAPAGPSQNP